MIAKEKNKEKCMQTGDSDLEVEDTVLIKQVAQRATMLT